ncbi:unnamed protein product [Calypogeia fissa]
MDENASPTGEKVHSNGVNPLSEIELQASTDGINGQETESGQQGNGNSKPTGAGSQIPAKIMSRKKTRKEQSLESWAQNEPEPNPCRACGFIPCCCWSGSFDSLGCPLASPSDVFEIFHHSRLVLGAYGTDMDELEKLIKELDSKFSKHSVVKSDPVGHDMCPPHFINRDDERREVALYMRGLNLLHKADYVALMSNRKHEQAFHDGYLHEGMGKAAEWCLANVVPDLKEQLVSHEGYRLTLVGHSLGAGVCSILTALILEDREAVGGIDSQLIRAYAIAPPRVLSLNLAKRYALNIFSVIYQDDFLARISTASVKRVFIAAFAWTGFILFLYWLKQEMTKKPIRDHVFRLHPPGQIFHVVYRQPGVSHDMPIQVRVVESAEGRFERIILSSSGTAKDHSVLKLAKHLKTYDWPPEFRDKI